MTFHEWYRTAMLPHLYHEQAPYERESVAFQAIEKLTPEQILDLYHSMSESELRLALFDHLKNCMMENWKPDDEDDFPDEPMTTPQPE